MIVGSEEGMEGKDGNLGLRLGTVVMIGGDERGWEVLSLSSFVFLSFLLFLTHAYMASIWEA